MNNKEKIGIVVRNKMQKSVVVLVQKRYLHSKYGKNQLQTKRYIVHDEKNELSLGDLVIIEQSRPLSKLKNWKLKFILKIYNK